MSFVSKYLNQTRRRGRSGPIGWKDLISSISSARVPPSNAPTADTFGPVGVRQEFRFAVGNYIFIQPFHTNHDIVPNGKAYLHVHWSTNGTNVQPVRWRMDIMRAKGHSQESFAAVDSVEVTQSPMGVAWSHVVSEASDAQALTMTEPDELFLVTLTRIANGGTENTDKVFGLTVDFHYESDRDTTPNKSPNFWE